MKINIRFQIYIFTSIAKSKTAPKGLSFREHNIVRVTYQLSRISNVLKRQINTGQKHLDTLKITTDNSVATKT